MRKSGVIAILLTTVLIGCLTSTAWAESAPVDIASTATADTESSEMLKVLEPTAAPSDAEAVEEPSSSVDSLDTDIADTEPANGTELPSDDPEPTPDLEQFPSSDASAAEPTAASTPSTGDNEDLSPVLSSKPLLEIAQSTIHLHQETPSAQVIWQNHVPASVAGYIWSVQPVDGASKVFYVTYDRSSTTLAAGALNGHINAPGTYVLQCQPVDENQEPATEPAREDLYVELSSLELSVTANRTSPVPVGSTLTLTANISGVNADDVTGYEWKPSSGSFEGEQSCRISSVTPGPTRYTCTAVLRSGERVTGTIVVTGTELTCDYHRVTLCDGHEVLDAVWSNGTPGDSSLQYRWSVQGASELDLSGCCGMSLSTKYLADLPARDNPYTVTCQAFSGSEPVSSPAVFHVQSDQEMVSVAPAMEVRQMKRIVGDENGKVPNTGDAYAGTRLLFLCASACIGAAFALWRCRAVNEH